MNNSMYCSRCQKTLDLTLFFDAKHGRYLAYCLPCRRGTVVVEPDVVAPKSAPEMVNLSARKDRYGSLREDGRSNIRIVPNVLVAASIKHVIDQL